jgi:ABC-type oligopeptide transport system ATPase subunit
MINDRPVLAVKDLKTYFSTNDGTVKAVDGVSFELRSGETLASWANRGRANRF